MPVSSLIASQQKESSQRSEQFHPSGPSQETQTEILTQNPDLTQLGDDDDDDLLLSPLPPYSPSVQRKLPWGRLMPTQGNAAQAMDLLPRAPLQSSPVGGISCMGLDHLHASDIFNEHWLGRSPKCDVQAVNPQTIADKHQLARQNWAFGMISNRHCRIYCSLDTANRINVWLEDSSGNGTLVNRQTLLRRGEKRLLHSGDEICLVNAQTLQKKVRSSSGLQVLLQQHSFVFVNVHQQQPASVAKPARKAAVNVRATKSHGNFRPDHHRRISPRRQETRRVEQDYDIREVLGNGTAGEVRRAIHRQTGQERAVKIISTNRQLFQAHTLQAEATLLQKLQHPHVVQLIDVYVSPAAVYLVMELLKGGDLFDRIVAQGRFSETESRRVMRRLLAAIHYLHQDCNVVHRDLKPENILLQNYDSNVHVKLTDFGLAKTVNDQGLKTFCGTPQYFAPEVLKRSTTVAGRGRYGKPADMWSLGVILYVLLSGTPPFDDDSAGGGPDFSHWDASDQARDLIERLLVTDPRGRATVQQACEHAWILTDDGDTHVHPLDDPCLKTVGDNNNSQDAALEGRAKAPMRLDDTQNTQTGILAVDADDLARSQEAVAAPTEPHDSEAPSPMRLDETQTTKPMETFEHPPSKTQGRNDDNVARSQDAAPKESHDSKASSPDNTQTTKASSPMRLDDTQQTAKPMETFERPSSKTRCLTGHKNDLARSQDAAAARAGLTHSKAPSASPMCLVETKTTKLGPVETVERPLVFASQDGLVNAGSNPSQQVPPSSPMRLDDTQIRPPLSPVQLNRSVEEECRAEKNQLLDDSPVAANTPATSTTHRSTVGRVSEETAALKANGLELSDDEVLSSFSDKTESISSFTEVETTTAAAEPALKIPPRKRRVTEAGDSLARSEPARKTRKKKDQTKNTGGKQAKLSNGFEQLTRNS